MAAQTLAPNSSGRPSGDTREQPRRPGKLVLVVDDEPRILRFVSARLRLSGYDVVTAGGGEEALSLVDSARPDVVLLDIFMAPVGGLEVLKRLRVSSDTPVIAVSAHASSAGEALTLGANAFLAKPFDPEELLKEIRAVLGGAD